MAGWVAILTVLVYLSGLFAVAHYGDTRGRRLLGERARPAVYALTLCVYCTSWTFFGSVGLASTNGLDFLSIYVGPALVIGLGYPFVLRVVRLARSQNITSVADFVAARYGKSDRVAALVATIAVIGAVPYIALQLKAISNSLTTILNSLEAGHAVVNVSPSTTLSVGVAIVLAGFAMAFGTRQVDATEHHDGLMLAIATESVVKLVTFLLVGIYVTYGMFGGFSDLIARLAHDPDSLRAITSPPDPVTWTVNTFLSACCILLLPRQFHVTVVENRNERDVRTAAWIFPLYLVAINLFVLPLAAAGRLIFAEGAIDRDMTVLALPLEAHAPIVAIAAMVGGLSAATAMVIVACVALSIMVANDLVMPILLRGRAGAFIVESANPGAAVLLVRRLAIVAVLAAAYVYFRTADAAALAEIGLLSFAAVTQIAPAFLGGLFWRGANIRGAVAGLSAGILTWAYMLLLPTFAGVSPWVAHLVEAGPWDIAWLRPNTLFGLDWPELAHGVFISLTVNVVAFVGLSLSRRIRPVERVQADVFIGPSGASLSQGSRLLYASATASELEATVARYLGADAARRAFDSFMIERGIAPSDDAEADVHLLRFAEHLLASAIGTASARLVLSLLLRHRLLSREAALKLIDDSSAALQYNRDLLQHALDFARQGITVFDKDWRLICWNREFRDLFDVPADRLALGMRVEDLLRINSERGIYGPGAIDDHIHARSLALNNDREPSRLRLYPSGIVIEIRSARMPDGGLVTTYTDITETVEAEEALAATNETLEHRVRERTVELERLNGELTRAKAQADNANLSKTRFLAAASHDILQPLNAARLYATTLVERIDAQPTGSSDNDLLRNLDASLESVEEIIAALLEISRLDADAMKVEVSSFRLEDLLTQMRIEFGPMARRKGLKLTFVTSSLAVRSDRRLLSRLLQNLISNAIKYTPSGRVVVGARRRGASVEVQVIDTGLGIPENKQKTVFREFERLAAAAKQAQGLGLGLSIVERISKVLGHRIAVRSVLGRGSTFSVDVPVAIGEAPVAVTRGRSSAPHVPLAGQTVIAIDNEPRILEGLRALLEGWGCVVVTAASLDEAVAVLTARDVVPNVVLADYHLDDADGIAAITALRERFGNDLPALLATADRSRELRAQATSLDIRVLNKPMKPAQLRSLLSQWHTLRRAAE